MSEFDDEKIEKYSAAHWNKLRASFQSSMLVDTRLSSLAESLDTENWPIKGKEETPAKYVDLTLSELQETPEMQANPERIRLLMDILEGTLAFDDPFGEMVQAEEASASEDNEVLKNLNRLQISPNFPLALIHLSAESKTLCTNQQLNTLQEFAEFSQSMAQHIVLAGDFRRLLNALAHIDEKTIAAYLPYRPGAKGLHLPESVALLIDSLTTEERLGLYHRYGGRLETEEINLANKPGRQRLNELEQELRKRLRPVLEWFTKERDDLRSALEYNQPIDRFFVPLNDPVKETIAVRLAADTIKGPPARSPATAAAGNPAPAARQGGLSALWRKLRGK